MIVVEANGTIIIGAGPQGAGKPAAVDVREAAEVEYLTGGCRGWEWGWGVVHPCISAGCVLTLLLCCCGLPPACRCLPPACLLLLPACLLRTACLLVPTCACVNLSRPPPPPPPPLPPPAARSAIVNKHFEGSLGADDFIQRVEMALYAFGFTGENSIGV